GLTFLAAVTGHGIPMSGELLSTSLKTLVKEFDKIAVPDYGKYVDKKIH
ncbi:MBL fold metallo-hydrolase, partial [Bacillus sp. D-CC]